MCSSSSPGKAITHLAFLIFLNFGLYIFFTILGLNVLRNLCGTYLEMDSIVSERENHSILVYRIWVRKVIINSNVIFVLSAYWFAKVCVDTS